MLAEAVSAVGTLVRPDPQVGTPEPEPYQLNPQAYQPTKNEESCASSGNEATSECRGQVGTVGTPEDEFFTVAKLAELGDVSVQAVFNAINQGRLEAEPTIDKVGLNKNRKSYKISVNADFSRFKPGQKAKAAWDAQNQLAIHKQQEEAAAKDAQRADAAEVASFADWQRDVMDARIAILSHLAGLVAAADGGMEAAVAMLIADAHRNALPPEIQALAEKANARRGKDGSHRTLSRRSIYRWMAEAKQGQSALAPQQCHLGGSLRSIPPPGPPPLTGGVNPPYAAFAGLAPKAKSTPEPRWAPYFMELWRTPQNPSVSHIVNFELPAALADKGISPPTYRQVMYWLDSVGEVEKQRGRMLPRELKAIRPFRRRDTSVLGEPLMAVIADGHTFDAEVAHPWTGRPFRPEITVAMCLYTRRIVGVSVGLAESSLVVMEAVRHCFLNHGIAAIFYCDNGSGYKNQWNQALMERAGCTMTHSIAYNSQARGAIERLHQTVWVNMAAKKLPTYMGDAMDRQARQIAYKATRKGQMMPSGGARPARIPPPHPHRH